MKAFVGDVSRGTESEPASYALSLAGQARGAIVDTTNPVDTILLFGITAPVKSIVQGWLAAPFHIQRNRREETKKARPRCLFSCTLFTRPPPRQRLVYLSPVSPWLETEYATAGTHYCEVLATAAPNRGPSAGQAAKLLGLGSRALPFTNNKIALALF
jgi:hypothetical protein